MNLSSFVTARVHYEHNSKCTYEAHMSSAISVMFNKTVLGLWNVFDKIWDCHLSLWTSLVPRCRGGPGKEANSVPARAHKNRQLEEEHVTP